MKPVVIYVGSIFALARAIVRIRAATQCAIAVTGAAKITIEPAEHGAIVVEEPRRDILPPLAAAAMVRGNA